MMAAEISRGRFLRAVGGTAAGAVLAGSMGGASSAASAAAAEADVLEVPGAALYYEVHGSGPVLIMIPGASGTADTFRKVIGYLAARYTVVVYDRRGFARSQLRGAQDYRHRFETDADDALRLIEQVGTGPATVVGSSSGALVALEALIRDASPIRTVVPYEPPAMRLLPDGRTWIDFFFAIYDLYRRSGTVVAQQKFAERILTESDRASLPPPPGNGEPILVNTTYWFERELRQYPAVDLDLGTLVRYADRILPAVGAESHGRPTHEATAKLAARLDRDLTELPGGHLGFLSQPAAFAERLLDPLDRAGR
ncbi:alpha/beta fold hydrolase [Actinomadura sp. 6N118]|uniref:alpha/beta fold hydrolase n=1 Tax=Actinomadura sp. 6N118 TaxID=3375151 RepID=UPI003788A40D